MSQCINYIVPFFAVSKIALKPQRYCLQRSKKAKNIIIAKSEPKGD